MARRLPEWSDPALHPPDGWTRGRDMGEVAAAVQGLVRRGHLGAQGGEGYVVAVLREERERADAEARGERYRPRTYGPPPPADALVYRGGVEVTQ